MATNNRSKSAIQRREEIISADEQNKPTNNALKIKLDHLKTFEPLTENQRKFFELYREGAYCIGMLGSPGVGKCQGENVEVNLMVSDKMFKELKKFI